MAELIRKLRNYRISEIAQVYKIIFWLILICSLVVVSVIVFDNF